MRSVQPCAGLQCIIGQCLHVLSEKRCRDYLKIAAGADAAIGNIASTPPVRVTFVPHPAV